MKQAQSEHDSELIEIFPTGFGPTEAQNFFVFDWEFIVIGNFLAISDGLLRINGDFLLPIDSNNFSITIGLKRINKLKLKVPRIATWIIGCSKAMDLYQATRLE